MPIFTRNSYKKKFLDLSNTIVEVRAQTLQHNCTLDSSLYIVCQMR